MRLLFIISSSAYFLFSMWAFGSDPRIFLFGVGLFSFGIYWAYGHKWSSGRVQQTKPIVMLRRACVLVAFISMNALMAFKAIYGEFADIVYFILWLCGTSVVLYVSWLKMSGKWQKKCFKIM